MYISALHYASFSTASLSLLSQLSLLSPYASRANFGPDYRDKTSASAWMYQTAAELKSTPMIYVGKVGYYSGGGAAQNLHSLKNESQLIVKELKEALWIGRGTRAVFVDFTVYNANINLFCVIKLTFEFPATGGVLPSSLFRTVKLIRYCNALDYFVMALLHC